MGILDLFGHKYPFTDFHELNLDWCITAVLQLQKAFEDFSAGNKLVFADPLQHDLTKTYAKNTIVIAANGNAYLSMQPVPKGVQLSDTDYWLMVFDFTEYSERANKNFTDNYFENITRSPVSLSVGDWVVLNDILYKVISAIAPDDLFEVDVNIVHFTIEQFLKDFVTSVNQTLNNWYIEMTGTIQQYKNDIDASEYAYRQQLAQDIADTTASLQAQLDLAISGATVDSEVINARLGFDGVTYPTLGDAIRTNDSLLHTGYTSDYDSIMSSDYVSNSKHENKLTGLTPISGTFRRYSDGELVSNASYRCYDKVVVKPDTTYLIGYGGPTYGYHVVFFDAEEQFISGVQNIQSASGESITATIASDSFEVTTPSNAVKMSLSVLNAYDSSSCIIEKASQSVDEFLLENFRNTITGLSKVANYNMYCPDAVAQSYYVTAGGGTVAYNASFCYEVIEVEPNTVYTMGGYSSIHFSEYDEDGVYIQGQAYTTPQTITTSATTKYVVMSVTLSSRSSTYFCKGSYGKLSTYGSGNIYNFDKILEVGAGKQFTTIQAAVDAATDYDTILIYPGTYDEAVTNTTKFLNIIGVDRKLCILTHSDVNYQYPPLEIAKGYVANLTIETTHEDGENTHAYTTHIDYDGSIDSALTFENVYFHSEKTTTVGIGLRDDFTLTFKGCSFKCDSTGPAFYCHDDPADRQSTNQILVLENCTFENNSNLQWTIQLQTMEFLDSHATLIAQRNIVKNHGTMGLIHMIFYNPSIGGSGYLGSYDWELSDVSALNTLSDLNSIT